MAALFERGANYPAAEAEQGTVLPQFKDVLHEFHPDAHDPFRRIHEHSIWRDVAHVGITFNESREYSVVTALPKIQLVETPIFITTAFQTSTRGHNEHTMLRLLNLGFPVVMVGPEGEQKSTKAKSVQIRHALSNSLPLSTHNAHEALNGAAALHNSGSFRSFDDENIIILGESRGAMLGMGLPAYARNHGRNVVYGDLTAPCFANRFEYSFDNVRAMAKQGKAESTAISGLAKTLGSRRFLHYPNTLNPRVDYQIQALGSIPALLSGDAGMMAQHMPEGTPLHIKVFADDFMSQGDAWKEIFATRPEVAIKEVQGAHLTLAADETLRHIESRLTAIRDQLIKNGNDVEGLNFWNVHLRDRDNLKSLITNT